MTESNREPVTALTRTAFAGPAGPVVLVIMDGIGIGAFEEGDAVRSALTPHLDWLRANAFAGRLKAHGRAVGLPRRIFRPLSKV